MAGQQSAATTLQLAYRCHFARKNRPAQPVILFCMQVADPNIAGNAYYELLGLDGAELGCPASDVGGEDGLEHLGVVISREAAQAAARCIQKAFRCHAARAVRLHLLALHPQHIAVEHEDQGSKNHDFNMEAFATTIQSAVRCYWAKNIYYEIMGQDSLATDDGMTDIRTDATVQAPSGLIATVPNQHLNHDGARAAAAAEVAAAAIQCAFRSYRARTNYYELLGAEQESTEHALGLERPIRDHVTASSGEAAQSMIVPDLDAKVTMIQCALRSHRARRSYVQLLCAQVAQPSVETRKLNGAAKVDEQSSSVDSLLSRHNPLQSLVQEGIALLGVEFSTSSTIDKHALLSIPNFESLLDRGREIWSELGEAEATKQVLALQRNLTRPEARLLQLMVDMVVGDDDDEEEEAEEQEDDDNFSEAHSIEDGGGLNDHVVQLVKDGLALMRSALAAGGDVATELQTSAGSELVTQGRQLWAELGEEEATAQVFLMEELLTRQEARVLQQMIDAVVGHELESAGPPRQISEPPMIETEHRMAQLIQNGKLVLSGSESALESHDDVSLSSLVEEARALWAELGEEEATLQVTALQRAAPEEDGQLIQELIDLVVSGERQADGKHGKGDIDFEAARQDEEERTRAAVAMQTRARGMRDRRRVRAVRQRRHGSTSVENKGQSGGRSDGEVVASKTVDLDGAGEVEPEGADTLGWGAAAKAVSEEAQEEAGTRIQRAARGHAARRQMHQLRDKAEEERRRVCATMAIQSALRGRQARARVRYQRDASAVATVIKVALRDCVEAATSLLRRHQQELLSRHQGKAAIVLQCALRGRKSRLVLLAERVRAHSARRIQTVARGRQARKVAQRQADEQAMMRKRELEEEEERRKAVEEEEVAMRREQEVREKSVHIEEKQRQLEVVLKTEGEVETVAESDGSETERLLKMIADAERTLAETAASDGPKSTEEDSTAMTAADDDNTNTQAAVGECFAAANVPADVAATKIQSVVRGKRDRDRVGVIRGQALMPMSVEAEALLVGGQVMMSRLPQGAREELRNAVAGGESELASMIRTVCSLTIQCAVRGKIARKRRAEAESGRAERFLDVGQWKEAVEDSTDWGRLSSVQRSEEGDVQLWDSGQRMPWTEEEASAADKQQPIHDDSTERQGHSVSVERQRSAEKRSRMSDVYVTPTTSSGGRTRSGTGGYRSNSTRISHSADANSDSEKSIREFSSLRQRSHPGRSDKRASPPGFAPHLLVSGRFGSRSPPPVRLADGAVTVQYDDGDSYEGGWSNSGPEGFGTYTWKEGDRYIGQWKGGCRHGQGGYDWADGSKHTGWWSDGKQNGKGCFEWADGRTYEGEWAAKHAWERKQNREARERRVYSAKQRMLRADGNGSLASWVPVRSASPVSSWSVASSARSPGSRGMLSRPNTSQSFASQTETATQAGSRPLTAEPVATSKSFPAGKGRRRVQTSPSKLAVRSQHERGGGRARPADGAEPLFKLLMEDSDRGSGMGAGDVEWNPATLDSLYSYDYKPAYQKHPKTKFTPSSSSSVRRLYTALEASAEPHTLPARRALPLDPSSPNQSRANSRPDSTAQPDPARSQASSPSATANSRSPSSTRSPGTARSLSSLSFPASTRGRRRSMHKVTIDEMREHQDGIARATEAKAAVRRLLDDEVRVQEMGQRGGSQLQLTFTKYSTSSGDGEEGDGVMDQRGFLDCLCHLTVVSSARVDETGGVQRRAGVMKRQEAIDVFDSCRRASSKSIRRHRMMFVEFVAAMGKLDDILAGKYFASLTPPVLRKPPTSSPTAARCSNLAASAGAPELKEMNRVLQRHKGEQRAFGWGADIVALNRKKNLWFDSPFHDPLFEFEQVRSFL